MKKNIVKGVVSAMKTKFPRGMIYRRKVVTRRAPTRYTKSSLQYAQLTKPQHYGPGRTVRNIEINLVTQPNTFYKFGDMLGTSIEQKDLTVHYNYYKVLQIGVIFLPQQSSYVDTTFKFQVAWTQSNEIQNITFEDNSKEVSCYRTKRQVFTFIPPDIPYLVGDTSLNPVELTVINPFKYTKTYYKPSEYFPGGLAINENGLNSMKVRVVFRIQYRGSRIPTALELNEIYNAKLEFEKKYVNCKLGKVVIEGAQDHTSEEDLNQSGAVDDGDRKD